MATVFLQPVQEQHLDALERLDSNPATSEPFEWRGYRDSQQRRRRWEQDGLIGSRSTTLAVVLSDQTLVGAVQWWPVRPGAAVGSPMEIGALLFPEFRGHGFGTQAQRQLVDYLFSTTLVNRVQATTDTENEAEQRVLERIGFRREGVLRGAGFVGGQWRDFVMYARLRHDPA
jgi:ribosomal-protein-alanine N-acetyltransferase